MKLEHMLSKWEFYFLNLLGLKNLNPLFPNPLSNYFDYYDLYHFWVKQGSVHSKFRGLEKEATEDKLWLHIYSVSSGKEEFQDSSLSCVISVLHLVCFKIKSFELRAWNPTSDPTQLRSFYFSVSY